MDYRKEIDGLRALAIVPVVLFHSGLPIFNWGYIGVDIFFVISGFLITSIIYPKVLTKEFSFFWFYENRIRRLFPALFLMICVAAFTSLLILDPTQLKEFSYSIFSSILFYSNFFFWHEIDYFETNSELMPLLHTWSLSIEEQFYIFFPIFLILIIRFFPRFPLRAITVLGSVSFLLWVYGNIYFQTATFYLPITRAWELLSGAFLAIYIYQYGFLKNKIFSIIGISILCLSFYLFSIENKLKNLLMFLPVIGTLLILSSNRHHLIVRTILQNKVSIFFGLISYSLYLFHQPIFAFAKVYFVDLEAHLILFLVTFSVLLSFLSWRYIEQIFRKRYTSTLNFSAVLFTLSIPLFISFCLAFYSLKTDGNRENYLLNLNIVQSKTFSMLDSIKQENEEDIFIDNNKCIFSTNIFSINEISRILDCSKENNNGVLIFGDSHAKDIFNSYQYLNKSDFVVGISANFCQAHKTINRCYFNELSDFLKLNPKIFKKIYFHQAGYFFLSNNGKEFNDKYFLDQVPLRDKRTEFDISRDRINKLNANLKSFPDSLIVIGPRIEPHIQTKYIKKYTCEYNFLSRPKLDEAFKLLDSILNETFSPSKYISLQELTQFSMQNDFLNCDEIYWSDGDHWSAAGELKFSSRLSEL